MDTATIQPMLSGGPQGEGRMIVAQLEIVHTPISAKTGDGSLSSFYNIR